MRFEVWTDVQCNAGVRVAVVRDPLTASDVVSLTGQQDKLTVGLSIDDPAMAEMVIGRVLRVVYDDSAQFDEWRVVTMERQVASARICQVTAEPIIMDLRRGLIQRTEADGTVAVDFELVGLTPSALLTVILANSPSYFAAGTVDPTAAVEGLAFSVDTPLSALRELAELTNTELAVRRNGTTNYLVDLVDTFNGAATPVHFRPAKNLQSYTYELDAKDQATRVYPVGQAVDDIHMTIAAAQWKVVSVVSNDVVLVDPNSADGPIAFDDQFNGLYLEKPDATLTQITDTVASSQTVTVASASGLAADDLVMLRSTSAGAELLYLDAPADIATYGLTIAAVERRDVPYVRNVIANPMLNGTYSGNLPPSWVAVGSPTTAENTDTLYTQFGGKSCHVTAAAGDEGVESNAVTVVPSAQSPYFSGYLMLWVVSGTVRVELIDLTNNRTYPTGSEGRAISTERNTWVALGVAGIDLFAVAAASIKLRVVADTASGAEFYVDAAQLTQTGGQQPFFAGDGAVKLWFEGNNYLIDHSVPQVTVDVQALDLTRVDPVTWPFDDLVLGGPVRIVDERIALDVSTRLLQRDRNLLSRSVVRVQLSNRTDTLTDRMVRPTRRKRFGQESGARFDEIGVADPSIGPASADTGAISYPVAWDAETAYLRVFTVETVGSTPPTPPESGEYEAGVYTPAVSTIVIATKANYYRKTVFVAYTRDNVRGRTVVLGPTQTASGGGPSAGPSGLTCGSTTTTTIPLSWTNGDATAQTRIYKNGVIITTRPAGATDYTVTGLTPSTSYDFEVAHIKDGVEHPTRSSATCSTQSQTLSAPTDIHAFGDTVDGVLISVQVAEETAHTIIERSADGSTNWAEILDWPAGQCSGNHAGGSGTWFFRARHRKEGYSDSSPTANNQAQYYTAETPESFFPCP